MTASRAVLTDRYIKSLKPAPAGKRTVHWDAAKPSFGIRITDRGVISFFVMRRMPGKPQPVRILIGRYPNIGLAQARTLATTAIGDLVSGIHPREREQRQHAGSFAVLTEAFLSRPAATRQRTITAIRGTVTRHLLPRWGSRNASRITRADVITMVEALDRTSGPYTAAKVLALASAIFRYAMVREQIASNPCTLIKITDFVSDMASRQRVLRDDEIKLLWQATADSYPAGALVRFLLLTAVRRSEAAHMNWGEVNLDDALWIVPAHRTKDGVPHEVPLSGMAMDLLRSLPRFSGGDFVFSTSGGRRSAHDFSGYKNVIAARATGLANWRFHDLRRTARTNLASLGVSPFIAELILGHQQKGVHAVYDVHRYQAEKRDALERWASKLRTIIEPLPANVVALKAGKTV
jgi:integrase